MAGIAATGPAPVVVSVGPRKVGPPIEKAVALRSETYLAAVRELPCWYCGKSGPSEAHHVLVIGRMGRHFDLSAIPLCRQDHDMAQQHRRSAAGQAQAAYETQRLLFERRGASWWGVVLAELTAGLEER